MRHPYKSAPDSAFWDRAVANGWAPEAVPRQSRPLVSPGEKLASAGSCFAANIVPYLEAAGVDYVRTELPPPAFREIYVEALSYHKFSAAYGNIYTARHLLQLLQRAMGEYKPIEDRWYCNGAVIDPFRPGLAFPASGDCEFDLLTRQHLDAVLAALREADVFVFTLGLTEAWISALDGAVYPACPGTIAGEYDPARHVFRNFTAAETTADLLAAFARIRSINPEMRFVLTVSPVPLVATATGDHVLAATIYSKSALRVAAQEVTLALPWASYFPAYEIVGGPQAPYEFYEANRRDVTRAAIDTVMSAFLAACRAGSSDRLTSKGAEAVLPARRAVERPQFDAQVAGRHSPDAAMTISELVASIECEEAASGI